MAKGFPIIGGASIISMLVSIDRKWPHRGVGILPPLEMCADSWEDPYVTLANEAAREFAGGGEFGG